MTAVREAILNALIHRDYSIHTEGMPIQLIIFEDRLELRSPGGLYGRLSIDQLGKVQPDTRNPVIAVTMEILRDPGLLHQSPYRIPCGAYIYCAESVMALPC